VALTDASQSNATGRRFLFPSSLPVRLSSSHQEGRSHFSPVRPEITILAAEPLPSTSWFPGAVGGIPPPPPPPAHIWGSTIAPSVQAPPPDTSPHVLLERPRPRPRTRLGRQPVNDEVKVQTLVKLREDGLATLAARAASDGTNPEASQGTYLLELLEAFSSDDWGFPDHGSEHSHSESEEEDGEDMATLRARINAFEQQQPATDGSCGDTTDIDTGNLEGFVAAKRPEPRPRPRLQGQPPKSNPPVIAPKPKSFSPPPKPSSKVFWEDGGVTVETGNTETSETTPAESKSEAQTSEEPSAKSDPGSQRKPTQTSEKPAITPKPKSVSEPLPSSTPVPAPRPPPPKLTRSVSGSPSPPHPLPPRRPPVAPRASLGAPQQEKSSVEAGGEPAQNTVTQTGEGC
ncbi:hypothetical protein GOODEAATRI_010692, partial [Goodea atripinnis]